MKKQGTSSNKFLKPNLFKYLFFSAEYDETLSCIKNQFSQRVWLLEPWLYMCLQKKSSCYLKTIWNLPWAQHFSTYNPTLKTPWSCLHFCLWRQLLPVVMQPLLCPSDPLRLAQHLSMQRMAEILGNILLYISFDSFLMDVFQRRLIKR